VTARDDYPDLARLRDEYVDDDPKQFGGYDAYRALDEIDRLRAAAPPSPAEMNDAEHAAWRDALLVKFPSLFRYHGDDA
jgi:hypothetical protein